MPRKDIGYLIKNINDKLKVKADADLKHSNLTLAQSRVLTFLASQDGQATQKEIEIFFRGFPPDDCRYYFTYGTERTFDLLG